MEIPFSPVNVLFFCNFLPGSGITPASLSFLPKVENFFWFFFFPRALVRYPPLSALDAYRKFWNGPPPSPFFSGRRTSGFLFWRRRNDLLPFLGFCCPAECGLAFLRRFFFFGQNERDFDRAKTPVLPPPPKDLQASSLVLRFDAARTRADFFFSFSFS